jgi:polar amino acid transport system substrate-binding protein
MKRLCLSLIVLAAAVTAGCGSQSDRALRVSEAALQTPEAVSGPSKPDPTADCADPTASLRPPRVLPAAGDMPAGTFMRTIQRRGYLIAGVDQNTLLFAYRDPFTGSLRGFEIDLLRQLAKAIFGNPDKVKFKAITTGERKTVLNNGSVDVVADAYTMTCGRELEVAFSTVYYDAGQRVLVPKASKARSLDDLAGKRVCATRTSTSIKTISRWRPKLIPVGVSQRTDCLVDLQEGTVDAVSTDDAFLFGFAKQDPYVKIIGPRIEDEPYGMAISKKHPEFVRFVNGVLDRLRRDGTWSAIHRRWLGDVAPNSQPPTPHYKG